MKQQVHITLTITLWLDAGWDEDAIVTHVRTRLPHAFGEELTTCLNPIDVLAVEQEAQLYGPEEP